MAWYRLVVVNEDTRPVQGVVVEAVDLTDRSVSATGTTNRSGEVLFTGLTGPHFFRPRLRRTSGTVGGKHYTGRVELQVVGMDSQCYDFIVDGDGGGTHLTLAAAIAAAITLAGTSGNVTIWVCQNLTADGIDLGGLGSSAHITIMSPDRKAVTITATLNRNLFKQTGDGGANAGGLHFHNIGFAISDTYSVLSVEVNGEMRHLEFDRCLFSGGNLLSKTGVNQIANVDLTIRDCTGALGEFYDGLTGGGTHSPDHLRAYNNRMSLDNWWLGGSPDFTDVQGGGYTIGSTGTVTFGNGVDRQHFQDLFIIFNGTTALFKTGSTSQQIDDFTFQSIVIRFTNSNGAFGDFGSLGTNNNSGLFIKNIYGYGSGTGTFLTVASTWLNVHIGNIYAKGFATTYTGPSGVGDDHGLLTGLSDDDHTQYVKHSILTTTGDIFIASSNGVAGRLAVGSANQVIGVSGGLPFWTAQSYLDHGSIGGLGDDDHSQYVLDSDIQSLDFLVGTASSYLAGEIVVGTTPGGELGGTWASPTVDATHSGSAHHTEAHAILSTPHSDSLAAGVTDGSIIIGNVTPAWSELVISIPASNVRNMLGIDNGELRPSWKTALDATNPAAIGSVSPGTSLVFSHRDHIHAADHGAIGGLGDDDHSQYVLDSAIQSVDFLVGTASAYLSGEIVVGTTPGGELGGTWASPTVDATHSGSAHHAQSHTLSSHSSLDHDVLSGLGDDDHTIYTLHSILTTTGDIFISSSGGTATRLAIGSANQILTVSGGLPVWAAPAAATAHDILSASHGDSAANAVTDGSIIIGNVTPAWSELVIAIPASNVRNVMGIDNGEVRPSWKTSLDATNPAVIGSLGPGTSLVFSHRDHIHSADHGAIGGLSDDDHTQYVRHSIVTTTGDLFIASSGGVAGRLGIGSANDILQVSGGLPAWVARSSLGLDHGADLAGLGDDDHTQYALDSEVQSVDFLVGTASGYLSGEIVVGVTPGGELGNTWASPTVDATHSGSAHHAQAHTLSSHSSLDHDVLSGLGDDDHSIYALLAGRGTGQTLIGGVNSGNDLTLQSTAHATRGSIFLGSSAQFELVETTGQLKLPVDDIGAGLVLGSGGAHIFGDSSGIVHFPTNVVFGEFGSLFVNTLLEVTTNQGVLIDSVLLKDGLVDGIDVAARDHAAAHTVAFHSDTSATGTELNTLTGAGNADALHIHDAAVVTYTPSVLGDWDGSSDPGDVNDALDELAERTEDLETVTEFMDFVFSNGANGVVGSHGLTVLNSTQKAAWSWTVPDDFVSLVEVVLFMIPDTTETIQIDITIGSNAPGENFDFNQTITANKQQSVTISDITEMSLTSITPTPAAGDLMGVLCESDTSDIRLVGVRVTYVRT